MRDFSLVLCDGLNGSGCLRKRADHLNRIMDSSLVYEWVELQRIHTRIRPLLKQ